ncbi:hypothetical protein [Streptomyces sp. NPDC050759]|uniref:hypothetical protein n=1 Tax=Streptomyces sp. NPDC050759 TaxID=3365635 RepID=UPI0037ACE093
MNYRKRGYDHWPHYEDITDQYYRHGRYFYGEDQDGRLRTGRIVAFYRYLNEITGPAIEPVVRFLGPDGTEGQPEYVSLGATTEKYWIGRTAEDVEQAWRAASSDGSWPQGHDDRGSHRADPWLIDPAHYLLFYAAQAEGKTFLGRVVGWDPPKFNDELPTPIVRLYEPGGSLDGEALYVGLNLPDVYSVVGSLEEARQRLT